MSTARLTRVWLLVTSLLVMAAPGVGQAEPALAEVEKTIRGRLSQSRPDFNIIRVTASPMPGVYAVEMTNGVVLYSDSEARHFVFGDLFKVERSGFRNLSAERRDEQRSEQMAGVDAEDMIVFPAQGERLASVAIFTDVDCFYCQKIHLEVPELNRRGVEVRYLAYPRAGVGSDSYRKIASAWCARNKQDALTRLKNRETIPDNVCPGNPVADQFLLGQKLGVTGTPALVLESGQLLPGYMPADTLIDRLGIN